jgi:hypothetical protein
MSATEPCRVAGLTAIIVLGSFRPDRTGPVHATIRALRTGRDGEPAVTARLPATVGGAWPEVRDAVVVPVPGHLVGGASAAVERLAVAIADLRHWRLAREALRRVQPSAEGKAGPARDPAAESATLDWARPAGAVVVLVDDVVRSGATIRACTLAIRATGDVRDIRVIALGRAHVAGDPPR